MANVYKVLGQEDDASAGNVTLYTVPASTETIISTIAIVNREAAENTFRIAIRPDGATIDNKHYLNFDTPIAANDSIYLTLGITLDAADVVAVTGSDGNVGFSIFGTEIS